MAGTLALCVLIASPALAQRIPGSQPRAGSIQGLVVDDAGRGIPGVHVVLVRPADPRRPAGSRDPETDTTADGIFRFLDLPAGIYSLTLTREGFEPLTQPNVDVRPSAFVTVDLKMGRTGTAPPPTVTPETPTTYGRLPVRGGEPESTVPPEGRMFMPVNDRWNLPMPDWHRYGERSDYPYYARNWWDPYNRNILKGDEPVLGKRTFFTFTGVSDTLLEGRNLPTPSAVGTARPLSEAFFGRGGSTVPLTVIRTSFDVFRGDTAFRPIDWRIRIQPAYSLNFVNTAENGGVNIDVRRRTNRLDSHIGFQEMFGEAKLTDLSSTYDFLSVRAGIQEFSSDFRGFISVLEAPGARLFGTLKSSRIEFNAAAFDLLEKDTNSGFNEFNFNEYNRRHQQVYIGNVYIQDFLTPGYTTEFSFHANRDHGELHFDRNGFLVRPQPVGTFTLNDVRAYYIGWAGNGHVGRLNVSHAFYQALGSESANAISTTPQDINAQMAGVELSIDKDWLRIKGVAFYASGDKNPDDGTAKGFDAILDIPLFAGGPFSFWNRNGLRLTQTGTGIKSPLSLLPSLRTNKDEGEANFINPGIALVNGAMDVELTQKLRGFVTVSFLRFMHTESLRELLFQEKVRPNIGLDYGGGFQYRPPLSENFSIVGGAQALKLGQGLKDIYTRSQLFSLFVDARLVF